MPSELTSIAVYKGGKRFNNSELKSLAVNFGIVESMKETQEHIFVNFSKITDIGACLKEFRNFGFKVEQSRRNKQSSPIASKPNQTHTTPP